jgi:bifunctional DNA-binding transcriptional regulator/antitoxin component of YhaV-PrlF toxin-antitoxin module
MTKKRELYPEQDPNRGTRVEEARVPYMVSPLQPPSVIEMATTRLSSKNQITLPVAMVRMLGLRPGDEVDLTAWQDAIRVERHLDGEDLLTDLEGSMAHVPEWSTKEKIDEYIRNERDSWNREWDQD